MNQQVVRSNRTSGSSIVNGFELTRNCWLFLCPNCHSQTDNFAGKANKKGICNRAHVMTRKYICKNCGKPLHREPKTGLCKDCLIKQQKANKSACFEKNKVEAG